MVYLTYGGLLIAAIALSFILGWVIVEVQRAGQYDLAFAVSVFAIVLIAIATTRIRGTIGDSSYICNLFLQNKKSISNAILTS
ncbi:MAG: hypothetical protein ACYTXL_15945 [Nostoc sp.]